jgi:hypothetical protein
LKSRERSRPAAFSIIRLIIAAGAIPAVLAGQLPPSDSLAPGDVKPFHDELRRTERMLGTASDPCTVQYAVARTLAAGGQYEAAMRALEKAVGLKVGLDPTSDEIFAKLRPSREFQALLGRVRTVTVPVSHSAVAFTVGEPDLFPEGIAYDPVRHRFLLGSTFKHKIIECTDAGACRDFVSPGDNGLSEVLGVRVSVGDGTVWATSNGAFGSGLFHYNETGGMIRKYMLPPDPGGHVLNDLATDREGNVYVTDTRAGTVYWLSHTTDRLEVFAPALKVTAANGIAVSERHGTQLYVAGYLDGITVVDVASKSFHTMRHPRGACLATIDGLYFFDRSLVAIQNGVMAPRVVRLRLNRDFSTIDGIEVLERRNPEFEGGPTTAAIANGELVFMANPQLNKLVDGKIKTDAGLRPITMLRIHLDR